MSTGRNGLSPVSVSPPNTPPYATLLSPSSNRPARSAPKAASLSPLRTTQAMPSPAKGFNFTQLMLSGITSSSAPVGQPTSPRREQAARDLMTTRHPLSIPVTTVNFRRFVARCGVIFWVQDRIEEVILWKRGWKVTAAWMASYAFLCWFPRMILFVPHAILLIVLLSTYVQKKASRMEDASPPPTTLPLPAEGSAEWYANLQAIQNLMGFVSDTYDSIAPFVPHLTNCTPYSVPLTRFLLLSGLLLVLALPFIPLRPLFLVIGLAPFIITHPSIRALESRPIRVQLANYIRWLMDVGRNEDALGEAHWTARAGGERQWGQVETWERETLTVEGEAKTWRGEAGRGPWEVTLIPGWAFVETEDWVLDRPGLWAGGGADADGWIYSDSAWQHQRRLDEADSQAMTTRRRRWTRRIYRLPRASK